MGGLSQNADTADAGEGSWGLSYKMLPLGSAVEGWESQGLEQQSKKMRPKIIKLIEFFLNPAPIP